MKNKVENKRNSKQLNILAVIRSVSWLGLLNKLLFQWFFCSTNKMSREAN